MVIDSALKADAVFSGFTFTDKPTERTVIGTSFKVKSLDDPIHVAVRGWQGFLS